jgi:K+ transporter
MNNPGTITPKMIASSAVNGLPSSFLKNVVKIFFIALYILIVKLQIQNHANLAVSVDNI